MQTFKALEFFSVAFWGLRCGFALRRYVSQLASLLGPAAALPLWSGLTATAAHR